jgi:WD40 repeat protein
LLFVSSGAVRRVVFDLPQNPNILASCSEDTETIKIWDITSGSCLSALKGQCSKDNPKCTCELYTDQDGDECHDEDSECPVTGHNSSGGVTQVEFVDTDTVVSSSDDGTTCAWDVATGTPKADFEGDNFSFTKSRDVKQTVGPYVVTKEGDEGDLVLVHLAHGLKQKESTTENNHAVAFFRAPGVVQTLECAGDRIAVGCRNGEVLHLQAPWLVDS